MFGEYFLNNQNKIMPFPKSSFTLLIPFFWLSDYGSSADLPKACSFVSNEAQESAHPPFSTA